ncbi:hypothetical protein BJX99DRAFT_261442 [Aspergillus californicus]
MYEDYDLFLELVQKRCGTKLDTSGWFQDMNAGVGKAFLALLLPLISDICELKLAFPFRASGCHLSYMFAKVRENERPFDTEPAFSKLQDVTLVAEYEDADDEESPMTVYLQCRLICFFEMKAMRTLSVEVLVEDRAPAESDVQVPRSPLVRGQSTITELEFTLSNGGLGFQHYDSYITFAPFQPKEFYRTLSIQKDTLETLWLDNLGIHVDFEDDGVQEKRDEWFGSLVDFVVLKDLRIRLPNLLDIQNQPEPEIPLIDILPSSIERIFIEKCTVSTLPMLIRHLQFIINKRDRFPTLGRIDIEGMFHDVGEQTAHPGPAGVQRATHATVHNLLETLREVCRNAGVKIFIRDRDCPQTMEKED